MLDIKKHNRFQIIIQHCVDYTSLGIDWDGNGPVETRPVSCTVDLPRRPNFAGCFYPVPETQALLDRWFATSEAVLAFPTDGPSLVDPQ